MLLGIDFDNTIAGYDGVFTTAARERGYITGSDPLAKLEIRNRIRALNEGEEKWMALQGEVYGKRMKDAELMPGVASFLKTCRQRQVRVCIVSHKTEYGHYDADRVNLREASRAWMNAQGFFDAGIFAISPGNVFFESTRPEKIKRIAKIGCTHFIDDLEEVFDEPGFPDDTKRILYDPLGHAVTGAGLESHSSWQSIENTFFGY